MRFALPIRSARRNGLGRNIAIRIRIKTAGALSTLPKFHFKSQRFMGFFKQQSKQILEKKFFVFGFSIIELLVVISIIVVISLVTVPSLRKSKELKTLEQTAEEISLLYSGAETRALAVYQTESGAFPGYGVHMDKRSRSVVLFPDLDGDGELSSGEDTDSASIIYELPALVRIKDIRDKEHSRSCRRLDIVYIRPLPTITVSGPCGSGKGKAEGGEFEIQLETESGRFSKSVFVLTTGILPGSGW